MKALIIEDETAAAINLEALLRKVEPSLQIEAVLESVGESVEWLSSHPMPDLIFMDIHLADGESFRIFDRVEIDCPIIFTTAYDQYALEAFKVNSIDYLLKPITQNDLQRALDKLHRLSVTERRSISERVTSLAAEASKASQNVFLIQVRDRIRPLKFDEAAYFYTSDERVTVHTFSGEVLAMDLYEHKLALIEARARSEGVSIVRVLCRDSRECLDDCVGRADCVLADVPCSGLGVFRRKPEIKYKQIDELSVLVEIQKQILAAAAAYVKPGGTLVYSTCTIHPAENEMQTAAFLSAHEEFTKIEEQQFLPQMGMDGLYYCKMRRAKQG